MKLSDSTLTVLKNFAGINNSILVKEGSQLRTISVAKNILAEAEIPEDFPRDVAIYDLNQFLNGLSLHQDPNLDFTEDAYISIEEGKRRVKYLSRGLGDVYKRQLYQLRRIFLQKQIYQKIFQETLQYTTLTSFLMD